MPGKNLHLTPLESRKRLLLVESELNRAQLLNELHGLKTEMCHWQGQLQAIGSIAATVSNLAATISAMGRAFTHRSEGQPGKSSLISTVLNGVRTGASIWGALRSHPK